MKKRKCIECKEEFLGRVDKKFCSDQCRSAHNNRRNSDETNFVRNINNILRKNRRILGELNPDGKTNVHREQLLERGFRFSYFTNEYITKAGKVYRYCYDQGYLELDHNFFTLVRRKAYVD